MYDRFGLDAKSDVFSLAVEIFNSRARLNGSPNRSVVHIAYTLPQYAGVLYHTHRTVNGWTPQHTTLGWFTKFSTHHACEDRTQQSHIIVLIASKLCHKWQGWMVAVASWRFRWCYRWVSSRLKQALPPFVCLLVAPLVLISPSVSNEFALLLALSTFDHVGWSAMVRIIVDESLIHSLDGAGCWPPASSLWFLCTLQLDIGRWQNELSSALLDRASKGTSCIQLCTVVFALDAKVF